MRKKRFLLLICLLITLRSLAQSTAPKTVMYHNPVIAGDFADPSVIRVGNTYYAVGTSSEWGPVFPIYTSADLVNWTYLGPVFTKLPAWTMGSFWAPELYYQNGTFYVYYTARRKSDQHSFIGVATTRDLKKGFTDHGLLLEWTSEAIDPFIIDDQGKRYITWKAYGLDKGKAIELLGAELSPDGLKVIGQAFPLLKAERDGWEAGGMEGQALFKRGRYYYMTYSGNSCCGTGCNYQVGLARAEKLAGPWEKYAGNPVLVGDKAWKCPGHGTVVVTPNNRYFYLHHAYSGTDFTFVGRQGVLSELVWNEKTGWPAFRYGATMPAQAESPTGHYQQKQANVAIDFKGKREAVPWVWDVSQPEPVYTMQHQQLQLTNKASNAIGSFLGLVVNEDSYTFTVDVSPQADRLQSACIYGDANNALGIGVRRDSLELWQIKDGIRQVLKTRLIKNSASTVKLQIQNYDTRFYRFSWLTTGNTFEPLTENPIDGSFLPRWDRAPRIGISISGPRNTTSQINSVAIIYN